MLLFRFFSSLTCISIRGYGVWSHSHPAIHRSDCDFVHCAIFCCEYTALLAGSMIHQHIIRYMHCSYNPANRRSERCYLRWFPGHVNTAGLQATSGCWNPWQGKYPHISGMPAAHHGRLQWTPAVCRSGYACWPVARGESLADTHMCPHGKIW